MHSFFNKLDAEERRIFDKLDSPVKIQDFLETLQVNFEKKGDTLFSPRKVLRRKEAHCLEGALFAACVLWYNGQKPVLLDLVTKESDDSHVVALFKKAGKWGAISKTNHAVLRYRDPVFNSPKEIAMSYFNEYFLNSGEKTLRKFAVFDLREIKKNWIVDEKDLWYIDKALNALEHTPIISLKEVKLLRKADPIERIAGKLIVWKR